MNTKDFFMHLWSTYSDQWTQQDQNEFLDKIQNIKLNEQEVKICKVTNKPCEYVCVMIDCYLSNSEQNVKESDTTEAK